MDGQHLFVAACTFMPHTFSCNHHILLWSVSLSDFSLGEYIHDKKKYDEVFSKRLKSSIHQLGVHMCLSQVSKVGVLAITGNAHSSVNRHPTDGHIHPYHWHDVPISHLLVIIIDYTYIYI